MPERYDHAAHRHLRVAETLRAAGELDDAGYHFGFAGECAVKHALRASGVENALAGRQPNPMRSHFPTLRQAIAEARSLIQLHATGRLAGPIAAIVLAPGFADRFARWDIRIRYADTGCTPVAEADCARWHADAVALVEQLAIL